MVRFVRIRKKLESALKCLFLPLRKLSCRYFEVLLTERFKLQWAIVLCSKKEGTTTYGPTNKWPCKSVLALLFAFFITFWVLIIFYVSRRDEPLDIVVSEKYQLPTLEQTYNDVNPRVPLLFHQMWKSETIPPKWTAAHEGCLELNAEYKLVLWTDEMIYNFMARHYPWFYRVFRNYPYHIQRVDVARYFILYHYGGVYLDVDAECKTPFRNMVKNMTEGQSVLLPMTDIYGVTNSFMVSEPKSEFFKHVMYELPNFAHGAYNLMRHTTIIFSTGPTFLSYCVESFTAHESIHVMSLHAYNEKHFNHAKGGSWHGADTEIIDVFHFHYVELAIIVFVVFIILVICCRSETHPRKKEKNPLQSRVSGVHPHGELKIEAAKEHAHIV